MLQSTIPLFNIYQIKQGDRVLIIGQGGTGKTFLVDEFIKIVCKKKEDFVNVHRCQNYFPESINFYKVYHRYTDNFDIYNYIFISQQNTRDLASLSSLFNINTYLSTIYNYMNSYNFFVIKRNDNKLYWINAYKMKCIKTITYIQRMYKTYLFLIEFYSLY